MGAEIYANDKLLGESPWKGNLPFDTYSFEIKKAGHPHNSYLGMLDEA